MSFSTVSGGCFFDNGMTVADFHSLGRTPSLSELLTIAVTGAARRCEKSFISLRLPDDVPKRGFMCFHQSRVDDSSSVAICYW